MGQPDDSDERDASQSAAKAILGLMNLPGIGSARIHGISTVLDTQDSRFEYLLDYDVESLVHGEILTEEQAVRFASDEQREWRDTVIEVLDNRDVHLIPYASRHYPAYLRSRPAAMAPPLLLVAGNPELLRIPGIAFAGARNVSPDGAGICKTLAREVAQRCFTVVSGGARGSDSVAHQAAVDAGGRTIVVLAEGILSSQAQQRIGQLDLKNTALVSTFIPYGDWQSWRAMERNRYILGLSDRLVVIEAGASGGTLAAGKEALKHGIETWVLEHAATNSAMPGNQVLLDLGARPIPVMTDMSVSSGALCHARLDDNIHS